MMPLETNQVSSKAFLEMLLIQNIKGTVRKLFHRFALLHRKVRK